MMSMGESRQSFWTQKGFILMGSLFFLITALLFRDSFYGIFGEKNYVTIHLIIEMFTIIVSFTIATQAWMIFPHTLSNHRLWLGALFFTVGFLHLLHAITYKGMPFFLTESSPYTATWFYMVARITESMVLLMIMIYPEKQVLQTKRWAIYSLAFLYTLVWIGVLFFPVQPMLPQLVIDGQGTTALKNNLQYFVIFLQILTMFFVLANYKRRRTFHFMLLIALMYLIIGDSMFTQYRKVYDITNFIGHIFQVFGFYFLLRALYFTSVEEPYLSQRKAEKKLKENEEFLHTVTNNLGEGVFVTDQFGIVTFMNQEAERLLQWKAKEFIGKKCHELIHARFPDGTVRRYEECPNCHTLKTGEISRMEDDTYICKDGSFLSVSYVATPLVQEGTICGVITVFRDITQQKKDQETIRNMAYYDDLTGLSNMRYFSKVLRRQIEGKGEERSAVLLVDVDRFKNINDSLGHQFGDLFLKSVAARMKESLPPNVLLSRMGGDEFIFWLSAVEDQSDVISLCEHIHQVLQAPLKVQHLELNITASIGIAIYPEDGRDEVTLLKNANLAMYESKRQLNKYQFFDRSMNVKTVDRLVLENDLHQALGNNELHLVYQPQIDIRSGKMIALEALIRWNHPKKGWISPAHFIPIAEETGLIIPIGDWVIRTACWQLKRWHEMGFPQIGVSVNLSTRQFYQKNLVDLVEAILSETHLPPSFLELEITESMTMNVAHSMETLQALKRLGVKISIDDFGTGYSSLAYLKKLPIDRLKIDQSFVRDLVQDKHDAAIVSMIISMADHLEIEVIAEGVENPHQLQFLQEGKCHQAQGYLFSPPLTSEVFTESFHSLAQAAKEYVEPVVH